MDCQKSMLLNRAIYTEASTHFMLISAANDVATTVHIQEDEYKQFLDIVDA